MSWIERLVPASFRGVAFKVDAEAATLGRRVDVQKIAGGRGSVNRDTGEDPYEFDVTAFVVGDDWDVQRDDLEEALRQEGPGALSLPSRGDLWVRVVGGVRVTTRKATNLCEFSFHVVREDTTQPIKRTADTAGALKSSAAKLRTAAAADFAESYDPSRLPDRSMAKVRGALNGAVDGLRRANGAIATALSVADAPTAAIDDMNASANSILSTPSAAITKMRAATNAVLASVGVVTGAIDRLTGLAALARSAFDAGAPARATLRAAKRIAGLGASSPAAAPGDTSEDARALRAARALYRAVRVEALATAAETYASASFDSSTAALDALDVLAAEVDDVAQYDANDELYQALTDLRATSARHLSQTAAQLPVVITRHVFQETPAIVLAHEYYGDATREPELVARNDMPLFAIGELEALSS